MSKFFILLSFLVASAVALPWHNAVQHSNTVKQSYNQASLPSFAHISQVCSDEISESFCKTVFVEDIQNYVHVCGTDGEFSQL